MTVCQLVGVLADGFASCMHTCTELTYSHDHEHVCIGFVCLQSLHDALQQVLDAATLLTACVQGSYLMLL